MNLGGQLPPEKRVRRAILELCEDHPFYGSVAMHVDLRVASAARIPTAGVLPEEGALLYNPAFVGDLDDATLRGLVAHEVLHLVLDFGERRCDRDLQVWNTAQDILINHMLVEDGFDLPRSGVIPENGRVEVGTVVVEDIGSKTSESVHDALAGADDPVSDLSGSNRWGADASGDRSGEANEDPGDRDGDDAGGRDGTDSSPGALADQNPGGFDVHLDGGGDERAVEATGTGDGPDWERIAVEAAQQSRRAAAERGTEPASAVERIRGRTSETVDWRALLRDQVAGAVVSGYTWRRPADKSRAAGTYLPDTESRRLEAIVALDTSGSMATGTLALALGELQAMEREYDELDLTLVQHDAAVQRVTRDWRPSEAVAFEAEGRGGTSHHPVFEWLRTERPGADLLVAVTDGMTDVPDTVPPHLDVVWVLVGDETSTPDTGVSVRVPPDDPRA